MNTLELMESAQLELITVLESVSGPKDLVLDSDLLPLFELVASARFLKEHGVDRIFKLESHFAKGNARRMYMIRPEIRKAKIVADHVNADKNSQPRTLQVPVEVVMVPRKLYSCEEMLEYEGVYGDVIIRAYDPGFIPLDKDVLSLEIPQFNRDTFLHRDQCWIQSVASSLHRLEKHFGTISNVYVLGNAAMHVHELMKEVYDKLDDKVERLRASEIGSLILIDRNVDYVSGLLSQLTYVGQLDETFGIHNRSVVYNTEDSGTSERVKLPLSNDDQVFNSIRDVHIVKAFDILSQRTKELVQSSKKRKEMSVDEIKKFVNNEMRQQKEEHKLVFQHVGACEAIFKSNILSKVQQRLTIEQNIVEGTSYKDTLNFLEDGIVLQMSSVHILRLCCLFSLTQGGLIAKDYQSLRTKFLQSYGYEHLITFNNLQKLGLFVQQENKIGAPLSSKFVEKMASAGISRTFGSTFQLIGKKLNLIPKPGDDYDLKSPMDPSFVFSGIYIPLTCQLALQVSDKERDVKWEELCKIFPTPSLYDFKAASARGRAGNQFGDGVTPHPSSRVLILFLGGLTYAEIAAFRMLERTHNRRYILATTSLVNGNKIMNDALVGNIIK